MLVLTCCLKGNTPLHCVTLVTVTILSTYVSSAILKHKSLSIPILYLLY